MSIFYLLPCASSTRHISETVHQNSATLYRMNAYTVKWCNIKLISGLSDKKWLNYANFCNCDLHFLYAPHLRHYSSEFKLCRNEVYVLKLCDVKLFLICQ